MSAPFDDDALANRFAALAQAVADAASPATDDLDAREAAALLALAASEGMPVGAVARVSGLSQSAAVRLVDRLERAWLARRNRRVSREVIVEATQRGRRRAEALARTRIAAAERFLAVLDPGDRDLLAGLVTRLTERLAAGAGPGLDPAHHCRFCERGACDCGLHPAPAQETAAER